MNVSALSTGSALSRTLPEGREGTDTIGQIGVAPRFDAPVGRQTAGLKPIAANCIGAPVQGGRIEAPRALAADRMEQVQADIPEGGGEGDAMSSLMALLLKFQKMQEVAR